MNEPPIRDTDERPVTVVATGTEWHIGIHSWSMAWGHSCAGDKKKEAPTRSIFLDVANAKRVRDALTTEIDYLERR